MKKNILIVILMAFISYACNDGLNLYANEVLVSNDCSNGGMDDVGMSFDSDAVHCGKSRDLYFSIEWTDPREDFFYADKYPVELYLCSGGNSNVIMDSVWTLETDSAKILNCEKLSYSNRMLKGTFCLNKFENSTRKDYVSYYDDDSKGDFTHYVIYSKFDSYKALCAIESYKCVLLYSCLIHYGESYFFSRIPTLDGVDRKNIWCIYD